MLIKSTNVPPLMSRLSGRRPWIVKIAVSVGCMGLMLAFGIAGAIVGRSDLVEKAEKALAINPLTVAKNYVGGFRADPEHLTIDIKHKHYVKLAAWREMALKRNQITSDLKNYVPVSIRHNDRELRAEVRLKGEWVDHVETDKWSLRVKLKGDDRLFGMKSFSLQHPGTRSYLNEWFYQRALAHEGVVALRYQFVKVTVNGRHLGVYALEEHFAKQLIENNEHREGVMIRFDAELRYKPFALDFGSRRAKVPGILRTTVKDGIGTQPASHIVAYDEEKLVDDEQLNGQFDVAYNLLQSLRDGRLPTHKVFDIDKLANYFAMSELMGALFAAPLKAPGFARVGVATTWKEEWSRRLLFSK